MFKKKKYHVILMGIFLFSMMTLGTILLICKADIMMPVMNGIEATRQIRQIEKDRHDSGDNSIPDSVIIALTASALTVDHQNAMKAGCNDFILKPVSLRWLERKVRDWGNVQGLMDYDSLDLKGMFE